MKFSRRALQDRLNLPLKHNLSFCRLQTIFSPKPDYVSALRCASNLRVYFFWPIQYYLLILKVCRTTLVICFETVVQLSQQLTRSCRNQYCATHGYLLDSSGNHMPKNSKDSELDTEKDIDFKNDKAVIKKASVD